MLAVLADDKSTSGYTRITWDGYDSTGALVADAVYQLHVLAEDARGRVDQVTEDFTLDTRSPGTLTRPEPGVPLGPRPEIGGTAHPGAQITVLDQEQAEVCSASTAADGHWSCLPGPALPPGGNRLQAVATLNGVSAVSEQIQITVADAVTDAPAAAQ